jgi:ATP-dependent DNA helicase DinG
MFFGGFMNIAKRLSLGAGKHHWEERPQQNRMAEAVQETLAGGGFLMVEAGTGVGKSFAYLFPAIEYALRNNKTVVISTYTLTLQEQLFQKDLPVVLKTLEQEGLGPVNAVLLKGRGNYLSKRRLKLALENNQQMDFAGESSRLLEIQEWAAQTPEGVFSSMPFPVSPDIWNEVKSDPYHCLGPSCATFRSCFYQNARKRASGAHLILVNHALLLADLALKMEEDQGVLPSYTALIVDEAHHLPSLAAEHLATSVSLSECLGLVKHLLYSDEKKAEGRKGLFTLVPTQGAGEAVQAFKEAAESFFNELNLSLGLSTVPRAYPLPAGVVSVDQLATPLQKIEALLDAAAASAPSEELEMEAKGTQEECRGLVRRLSFILERSWGEEACYVVEPDSAALRRGEIKASTIKAIPLDASGLIREHLLSSAHAVVFTSATLSVGADFSYFQHALGLDDPDEAGRVKTLQAGSPFDFKKQVTLFLPRLMPHPRREEQRYNQAVIEHVRASIKRSRGKAFVLFTSFKMLRQVADAIRQDLEKWGITLLVQGEEGWDRTRLLKVFREDIDSVLLGVNSFWEGVDVPGEALSNLIIAKLPFQVPEGPLVEARHARLKEKGLEPFRAESLPEAVLRLKQGFGRLIRTATDTGTVTILDPRVTTERWGRVFLEALPECEVVYLAKPGAAGKPHFSRAVRHKTRRTPKPRDV